LRIWSPTYQSTTEVRSNEVSVVLAFPVLSALGTFQTCRGGLTMSVH
jgi:hypothetical protein